MRFLVVSEKLSYPLDEGSKQVAYNLAKALSRNHETLALSINGLKDDNVSVEAMKCNRMLLNKRVFRRIRSFKPAAILYIPSNSLTLASAVRARLLHAYSGSPVFIYNVQPVAYKRFERRIISLLCSVFLVFVQSERTKRELTGYGLRVEKVDPGIDIQKFKPVSQDLRFKLRDKYSIPQDKNVVLHIGHIRKSRNIEVLVRLQKLKDTQVILVGSTSTHQEKDLIDTLTLAGVKIIKENISNVEELYQLADIYVFPVINNNACIEIPCSVLESMACDLPVITTPFGGLPDLFKKSETFIYAEDERQMVSALNSIDRQRPTSNRKNIVGLDWDKTSSILVARIERTLQLSVYKKRRLLICLTGIDGSGKTSQARALINWLESHNISSGYLWCRMQPRLLKPVYCLVRFLMLRKGVKDDTTETDYEKLKKSKAVVFKNKRASRIWSWLVLTDYLVFILPILAIGFIKQQVTVCDRYLYDAIIDLSVNLGYDLQEAFSLLRKAERFFPLPDYILMCDVELHTAMTRKHDIPGHQYLDERRKLYKALTKERHWILVDANRSIQEVNENIRLSIVPKIERLKGVIDFEIN